MKRGAKPFMPKDSVHVNLRITKEDFEFLEKFKIETYRSLTGSIRFAIGLMRKQYNEKGASRGM